MRLKLVLAFFITLFASLLISTPASADEVKLLITDDTYLSQSSPDGIYGNSQTLTVTAANLANKLILLKFHTGKIPAGSTVNSARLIMTNDSCSGSDTTPVLEVSQSNDDWNEDTVRWATRPRMGLSVDVIDATPEVKSFDVTKIVSKWVQGTTPNYGLILGFQGGPYTCNFDSREKNADGVQLVVAYTPPAAASSNNSSFVLPPLKLTIPTLVIQDLKVTPSASVSGQPTSIATQSAAAGVESSSPTEPPKLVKNSEMMLMPIQIILGLIAVIVVLGVGLMMAMMKKGATTVVVNATPATDTPNKTSMPTHPETQASTNTQATVKTEEPNGRA